MKYAIAIVLVTVLGCCLIARGENSYRFELGSAADLDATKPAHFTGADRVGEVVRDGEVAARLLKPKVYQANFVVPAFDFDAKNFGAVNHPFYLTVKFKDLSKTPVTVMSGKSGGGFYGATYAGSFGGAGDGQWKEETIVIRRSILRTADGRTFRFTLVNIADAVPVASFTLFSAAATDIADKDARIKGALALEAKRREALRASLLPKFKDVGLPDPGTPPSESKQEASDGYRVFFPPVARQLFGNSQPRTEELEDKQAWHAAAGQTQSHVVAVRGLKNPGPVTVTLESRQLKLENVSVRWADYREYRVGSSWSKTYRVEPNILVERPSQEVGPERLEIACVTYQVAADAKAGDYAATLTVRPKDAPARKVPVTLTVYPFKLEQPDHATHGMFYYASYGDLSPVELADMRNHGVDTLVAGMAPQRFKGKDGRFLDEDRVAKGYAMLKEQGFRSPMICDVGSLKALLKDTPENQRTFVDVVTAAEKLARDAGFTETSFFPIDEPHTDPLIADSKLACTWIKEVPGARTFITSNPKAVGVLEPVLDDVCYNLSYLNPKTIGRVKEKNETLMYYCPSFAVDPEPNRYQTGFYFFKTGAKAIYQFAYFEFAGDPFCDLDGPNRDWSMCYPSMDSATHDPTISWESLREGINDYLYAYTLQVKIAAARKAGKTAAADKAQKVLDAVMAEVDIDGAKAGGPAMAIEADTSRKNEQVDAEVLKSARNAKSAPWYDASRRKLAEAIVELSR
jgi:hypothetical protein